MKPFEIFAWQPPDWQEAHPAVIVSHAECAANKDVVEVLMCSTQRATRPAKAHEVILDQADGLDWPTLCKCDLVYAVPRENLTRRRGAVAPARRAALLRTLIAAHGWAESL